ncbi:MAG TPA: precorrin-8X methylmutase [Nitrospinota bacterium]|jgi:precorrin isomerase|nr:precorrin-8X methylmutase [Nitrospinota bacterium]|tara:strand:- start:216247 stop:216933 length:687 start_codon:yes stop_codon:yes gene_type:complete
MKSLARSFYDSPMRPEKIEELSFATIDREAPAHNFSEEEWIIVRRMIHSTANFELAKYTRMSPDAMESATNALSSGKHIYVDSNMLKAGISAARLKSIFPGYTKDMIHCHVADADVAAEAKESGMPRSLHAIRKAKDKLADGGMFCFGNSPVALMELSRMILEDGVKPSLVVAMPVGFVNVVESKDEFMSLGVPFVGISGRFGGSSIAVSTIHSLCAIAVERKKNSEQ